MQQKQQIYGIFYIIYIYNTIKGVFAILVPEP